MTVHALLALGAFAFVSRALPSAPFWLRIDRPNSYQLQYLVVPLPARPDFTGQSDAGARGIQPQPVPPRLALRASRSAPSEPADRVDPAVDAAAAAARSTPDPDPAPVMPGIQAEAIGPGEVAGVAGIGKALIDYARRDQRDQIRIGPAGPEGPNPNASIGNGDGESTNRVAELLGPAGTACPLLRLAKSRPPRDLTVSVGFDVDSAGTVDPATLHVVESPAQPQAEHRFYSHIYAVAGQAKADAEMPDGGAAYDSVVTRDVRQHVVGLRFRPALQNGLPVRSSVLVSCRS